MNRVGHRSSLGHELGAIRQRLIGLADEPTDDDDLRLRKRVGVVAGYPSVFWLHTNSPCWAKGFP